VLLTVRDRPFAAGGRPGEQDGAAPKSGPGSTVALRIKMHDKLAALVALGLESEKVQ